MAATLGPAVRQSRSEGVSRFDGVLGCGSRDGVQRLRRRPLRGVHDDRRRPRLEPRSFRFGFRRPSTAKARLRQAAPTWRSAAAITCGLARPRGACCARRTRGEMDDCLDAGAHRQVRRHLLACLPHRDRRHRRWRRFQQPEDAVDNAAVTRRRRRDLDARQGPARLSLGRRVVARGGGPAIAVGPSGADLSLDNGRTWMPRGDGYDTLSFAPGTSTAWAAGDKGRIAKLTIHELTPPPCRSSRSSSPSSTKRATVAAADRSGCWRSIFPRRAKSSSSTMARATARAPCWTR